VDTIFCACSQLLNMTSLAAYGKMAERTAVASSSPREFLYLAYLHKLATLLSVQEPPEATWKAS
jgi:hypothetical protein